MFAGVKTLGRTVGSWPAVTALVRLINAVKVDDIAGLSAELAYRFFLSLFPFFIFLAALGGFIAGQLDIDNPTDAIMDEIGESIPADVASVLRTQIDSIISTQSTGLISLAIAGALFTAASGIMCLIKGMNRIYAVKEQRPIWKRYVVALSLTLLAGGFLIAAFLVTVVGQVYGLRIAGALGFEGQAARIFTIARLPLVTLVVLVTVAFLYWSAPNVKLSFRWMSPGTVLFTLAWLLLNYVFGFYVSNFGTFNATYGALGGIVVVLLWFYLTSFLLLLGAEVNALVVEELGRRAEARKAVRAAAVGDAVEAP